MGGYVNIHLKDHWLQDSLSKKLKSEGGNFGFGQRGRGRKVIIDFSSPNVAKPMSVGHLRATVIGQAMCNLARSQGYEVIGLNHLGDWGVQFGKLAWAYRNWGDQYQFDEDPLNPFLVCMSAFTKKRRPIKTSIGRELLSLKGSRPRGGGHRALEEVCGDIHGGVSKDLGYFRSSV